MDDLIIVIITVVVLIVAFKLVTYCFYKFPFGYSIFLIVSILFKSFSFGFGAVDEFLTSFLLEFLLFFFYIPHADPSDYDTLETTTSYDSWADTFVTRSRVVHHHIPGWVNKLIVMAIYGAIAAGLTCGIQGWGVVIATLLELSIPCLRAWNAWQYRQQNRP